MHRPVQSGRISNTLRCGNQSRRTHSIEKGQIAKVAQANKDGRQRRAEQDAVDRRLLPLVEVGEQSRQEALLTRRDDQSPVFRSRQRVRAFRSRPDGAHEEV